MRKLNALLGRADDGLRSLLLGTKIPGWLLGVGTFAAFLLLLMTRSLTQLAGAGMMERSLAVLVLCLPLAVMLVFALRMAKPMVCTCPSCAMLCAVAGWVK